MPVPPSVITDSPPHPPLHSIIHHSPSILHKHVMDTAAPILDCIDYDKLELDYQLAAIQSNAIYVGTLRRFVLWAQSNHFPVVAATVTKWLIHLRSRAIKPCQPSTLLQYETHLKFFVELGILPGAMSTGNSKMLTGMGRLAHVEVKDKLLLPSMILTMCSLQKKTRITIAMSFQSYVGLRGGQLCQVAPIHLQSMRTHIVPPYKKCLRTSALPLTHVPTAALQDFLALGSAEPLVPILGLTKTQYQKAFKSTCKDLGCVFTSQSARHTFASVQSLLGTPLKTISEHLTHANPSTTSSNYVHPIPSAEAALVFKHSALFLPALPLALLGTVPVPARLCNG